MLSFARPVRDFHPIVIGVSLLRGLGRVGTSLFAVLVSWQERAGQRQELGALSDSALKDIGLSRADIELELDKPFWRS